MSTRARYSAEGPSGHRLLRAGRAGSWAAAFSMIAAVFLLPPISRAAGHEEEVKATFLMNFTRYFAWPASSFAEAKSPFVICILADPEFASTTRGVIGDRTVEDRPIAVSTRETLESALDCHILFLPASRQDQQAMAITQVADSSILTVSDSEGFASMGGIANFRRVGGRLRLEINRQAAARARLEVSARLLRIADVVG